MPPLVSVCMPLYNGEKYLRESVESVLSQSMSDLELIVCDDCSTDSSCNILAQFDDPRITLYHNEKNLGLAGNWNRVMSYASGRYIKIMMQDDLLGRDALERQTALMEANPGTVLSIGNTSVIDKDGNVMMERNRFKEDGVISGIKYARKSLRGRNIYCEPPNYLIRREALDRTGYFDTSLIYTPDWDLCLSLSETGDIACTCTHVMSFRISDSQETSKIYKKKVNNANVDSDKMFIKHMKSGILKLNMFDYLVFKAVIRIAAVARVIVLKTGSKEKRK